MCDCFYAKPNTKREVPKSPERSNLDSEMVEKRLPQASRGNAKVEPTCWASQESWSEYRAKLKARKEAGKGKDEWRRLDSCGGFHKVGFQKYLD